jgi:hypothetical protein
MLVSELSGLPGFDPKLVVQEGATRLAEIVGPDNAGRVVDAYNDACRHIFLAAMGLAFASLLCAFGMEWKSIKKGRNKPGPSGPPPASDLPPSNPALPNSSPSPAPLPDSPSPGTSSPDSSTGGPMPGKPFFEGVVKKRHSILSRSSRHSSLVRPKTRDDAKSEKKQQRNSMHSMFEGRKQGVLTKPAPLEQGNQKRPGSGARLGTAPEEKKDEMLAGALRDWARYSKAVQEARREKEKAGLEGE